jgi:hypothetical protein
MARRRPFDRVQFLLSIGIAVGLVFIAMAVRDGVTGKAASGLPIGIEVINPTSGSRQLRQASVQVKLTSGYKGQLIINGEAIPVDELTASDNPLVSQPSVKSKNTVFDAGNSTLTYQPQEGAPIDKFSPGTQTVRVDYWKIATPDQHLTFDYTFVVEA